MAAGEKTMLLINREEALERIGGDESFLKELLGIYAEEFEKKYAELEKAVSEKDFKTVREAGHYLKGASANLSLLALREAAWRMETAGASNDLQSAREALLSLKTEYLRFQEFLKSGR